MLLLVTLRSTFYHCPTSRKLHHLNLFTASAADEKSFSIAD
jgi:hypothetical protein